MDLREPTEASTPEGSAEPAVVRQATPSTDAVNIPIGTTLAEAERTILVRTIEATRGNKSEAARVLGISRSALYAKLARLQIA